MLTRRVSHKLISGLFNEIHMGSLCCLQITLLSRDEASMLVVSYADLKRCLEGAVAELRAHAPHLR
jgi:hypothetical protein